MAPNEGAALLAEIIEKRGITQIEVERAVGTNQGGAFVPRLLSGKRKPTLEQATKLLDLYGINPASWMRPAPAKAS